ncbi:MAG: riboflavin biosynthesis protein RibF [Alphaproteobacteria bacterium GM202ARS2]|nr:riboflavin biosynthesis protein RibF [Alphaproteobacteria bacterium GM202ARS2]
MQPVLLRDAPLPATLRGGVVVMGNFDGIHLAHQLLLDKARQIATDEGLALLMLTFEPHARQFFSSEPAPFRLMTLSTKLAYLRSLNAQATQPTPLRAVVALRFNHALASMSPIQFIERVLCRHLAAKHVLSGRDFRFGLQRQGTSALLAQQTAFRYHALDSVTTADGRTPISSSLVRACLRQGDVETATNLLGHPWQWRGHVIKGDQRGRTIGFATANCRVPPHLLHPKAGVYITQACLPAHSAQWLPALSNFGVRPTFGTRTPLLETHILTTEQLNLYGKVLYTRFIRFVRAERTFESVDALRTQLHKDCALAREFWQQHTE